MNFDFQFNYEANSWEILLTSGISKNTLAYGFMIPVKDATVEALNLIKKSVNEFDITLNPLSKEELEQRLKDENNNV